MSRSRAERRHNTARVKNRFLRREKQRPFWTGGFKDPAEPFVQKQAGLYANHGRTCSCSLCGNERRHFGRPTIQERRASTEQDDR